MKKLFILALMTLVAGCTKPQPVETRRENPACYGRDGAVVQSVMIKSIHDGGVEAAWLATQKGYISYPVFIVSPETKHLVDRQEINIPYEECLVQTGTKKIGDRTMPELKLFNRWAK